MVIGDRLMKEVFAGIAALLVVSSAAVYAGEYRIGPEDVLEIKFWQDPDLNSVVRVGQDGKITLDVIGDVQAAGKTTDQLQIDIVRQISRLNKLISQVVVRVSQYNYQHVFVSGQALEPGKKTFEEIPDLWTMIKESGGVTEFGDLSRVTIIRGEASGEPGAVLVVNVSEALASGELAQLPPVYRQDAIEIPRTPAGLPTADLAAQVARKSLIYVTGAVNMPGLLKYEGDLDIMDALAMAGGPTDNADLSRVRVITKDGNYAQTYHLNLRDYVGTGAPARYTLRKEDAVHVATKEPGFLGRALPVIGVVSSITLTVLFIWDRIDRDTTVR